MKVLHVTKCTLTINTLSIAATSLGRNSLLHLMWVVGIKVKATF